MEKWLEDIRESLTDFTTSEPDGLWEGIEAGLGAAEAHSVGGAPTNGGQAGTGAAEGRSEEKHAGDSRRRVAVLWWTVLPAAAAAVAALVLFLSFPEREDVPDSQPGKSPLAVAESPVSSSSGNSLLANCEASGISSVASPATSCVTPLKTLRKIPSETLPESSRETSGSASPEDRTAKTASEEATSEGLTNQNTSGTAIYDWPEENDRDSGRGRKRRTGGFRIGISAANVAGTQSTSSDYAALYGSTVTAQIHGFSETSADFPDSRGYAGVMQSNADNGISTTVKNFQPVQAGVTVAYAFTDRLSLESGLTYSCLISRLSSGSADGNYAIRQTLHYIGIPLSLRYDFLKFGRLSLYASAGGQAEKCVVGKTVTDYFVGGEKISSESGTVRVEPLQWSVNAHIGAQYNFNRTVGIYIEPGAAYYFGNGSPVNNIYSERPFNFSLRAGLRFSLRNGE